MFDWIMTGIYLNCCGFAVYRGHRKIWIAIALILALVFQYVLEFSDISLLVIAGIFIVYFVIPKIVKFSNLGPQGKDPLFDLFSLRKIKQIWAELDFSFSSKKEPKSSHRKPQGRNSAKSRQKSTSYRSRNVRPQKSSQRNNTTSNVRKSKRKTSPSNSPNATNTHLQNAVHQLAREKQELADQVKHTQKKFLLAEDKLKAERKVSKKHRNEIAQLKKRQTSDNRTPEEILGVKPGQYSSQELRDAWIMESKRWHTSNMGNKPQELVELAEEELKRVNAAYDVLKKSLQKN